MSPRLEDCPNEIIETIVVLLQLDDIRNLRQSCRSLAAKTTQDCFKSYYLSKHVDIVPHALRAFVDATRPGRLGCLVQELILVGHPNGPDGHNSRRQRQYGPEETELDLLSQAFGGIVAYKKNGELLSLSLQVTYARDDAELRLHPAAIAIGGWMNVWKCAAQTFHATLGALAASRLPLEKLDIFNDRQSQACSLACDQLGRVDFQDTGLAISLSGLKALSISLSDRIVEDLPRFSFTRPPKEKDIRAAEMKATAKSNFFGLAKLLQLMPSLDSLKIHYYRVNNARKFVRDPYAHHELLLKEVARWPEKLPKLKQCRLGGIFISEADLLAFIQRVASRCLCMENVNVSSGSFRSIFDYCISKDAGIEELHFDELLEKHNMLYFRTPDPVGSGQVQIYQSTGHAHITTSLDRVGVEVKHPITYNHHEGIPPDSPQTRELRRLRRMEYGPLYR